MIKRSWTALIIVGLFILIFNVSAANAEVPATVNQEGSSPSESQTSLATIFTAFSEVNTALEEEIKAYQTIIDDYTNGRATPNVTTSNLLKLNESIMDTRSKAFALKFTGKYEDDKIRLIRACDMLDQSLKDMKISVSLRNTGYYSKSKQGLQDAIQFRALTWKQINKDLQDDGYIPSN